MRYGEEGKGGIGLIRIAWYQVSYVVEADVSDYMRDVSSHPSQITLFISQEQYHMQSMVELRPCST